MGLAQRKQQLVTIDLSDRVLVQKRIAKMLFEDVKTPWVAVADFTGLSPQTLSRLAYGTTKSPHLRTVTSILNYYGYETGAWKYE